MWTIRQDQVVAFERYHLRKFEDEMSEHLKEFAPRHWKMIGEDIGREAIRFGIRQAEKYGFTNRGPVRSYIEMMFLFGSFFDTDPQYPWITQALNNVAGMDQMVRADWLYDRLTDYWVKVAGPENTFTSAALRKLSQTRLEDYVVDLGEPLEGCFLRALPSIYPQKCEYLGQGPLQTLLKKALLVADRHGFTSSDQMFLMATLAFFLGHECTCDPLHGRVRKWVSDSEQSGLDERSPRLRSEAALYLNNILGSGEEPVCGPASRLPPSAIYRQPAERLESFAQLRKAS